MSPFRCLLGWHHWGHDRDIRRCVGCGRVDGRLSCAFLLTPPLAGKNVGQSDSPSPTYWPGQNDREATGPIGDGTPHARMEWFWARMEQHAALISELTGYNRFSSSYRFEAAIADAFDKLAEERGR